MNTTLRPFVTILSFLLLSASAHAAKLILNEYNAVSSENFLNGGDEFQDGDGNIPPPADAFFGRVVGNGGDWFELVVVADHLDIRGWRLAIVDDDVPESPLVFSNSAIWANLRAGTIITVSEDVPDDVSYSPAAGDWWINVRAADPADGGTGTYITASNFPTSNDNWQLTILDRNNGVVFGPVGEGIVDDDGVPVDIGIGSDETFSLQGTPSAIIERFSSFYSDAEVSSFGHENELGTGIVQNFDALRLGLPSPDRDGDGIADDGDRSGIVGDNPCTGGDTLACDDNCVTQQDATQADRGGLGGPTPDGIGDACQCGDANDDGVLTPADVQAIRNGNVVNVDKCSVTGDAECDLADAGALTQALRGNPGAIAQVCPAAVIPDDNSDFIYDPDRVLEVHVEMDPADFEMLRNETRTWEDWLGFDECGEEPFPNPFNWYEANVTIDGQTINIAGIRKKGFIGSLSVEKPALKVDLDQFLAGQELNGVARFTFNNSKEDASFARTCLSYEFFRRSGIPAPRCNFAHVVVNDEDLGVYVNVETVKEPFLARNFPTATGKLWEGTGSDFWPGHWSGTFEPETDAAEEDRSQLDATATALSTLSGDALLDALAPLVDVDQVIHYWAVESVVSHHDGYHENGNNFFAYIDDEIGRIQLFPWDTDFDYAPVGSSIFLANTSLPRELYNIPETRAQFLAEVEALLDTWESSEQLAEIERIRGLLTPILQRSGMREELQMMVIWQKDLKRWIASRVANVNAQLADAPLTVPPDQPEHWCEVFPTDARAWVLARPGPWRR